MGVNSREESTGQTRQTFSGVKRGSEPTAKLLRDETVLADATDGTHKHLPGISGTRGIIALDKNCVSCS